MVKMGLRKGDFNRDNESDKSKGSSDEIGGHIVWLKSRACDWRRGMNVHVGGWALLEQLETYSWGEKEKPKITKISQAMRLSEAYIWIRDVTVITCL